jgi:hypothetical protein
MERQLVKKLLREALGLFTKKYYLCISPIVNNYDKDKRWHSSYHVM